MIYRKLAFLFLSAVLTASEPAPAASAPALPRDGANEMQDDGDFKEYAHNRKSSVGIDGSLGQNDYRSTSLSVALGLDPRWRISASGSSTQNGPGLVARELRIGVDAKIDANWDLGLQIYGRTEPADITARGAMPSASYNLASLWEGSLETRASLALDFARYSNAINQRMIELGLSHEFSELISADLQMATYSYGAGGFALARATRNRRASASGIAGLVDGYPTRSMTLAIDFTFSDAWALSLSGSKTQLLADTSGTSDTSAKSGEISVTFSPDIHWSLRASLSSSKSDSSAATRAGSVNLSYAW